MKIVLFIYVATVIFCLLAWLCYLLDIISWAKAEKIKTKKTGSVISSLIKMIIISLLPLINLIFGFTMFFSEESKVRAKDNILKNSITE